MSSYNTGVTGSLTNAAAATAFTFTLPAGILTNDVMIASIYVFTFPSATTSFSTPTSGGGNWTQIGSTIASALNSFHEYALMFYRVATASDASSTFSISYTGAAPGGGVYWAGDVESYTGFYTASPIGNIFTTSGNTGTSMTAPSGTTALASSWALYSCQAGVNASGGITGEPTTNRHVINPGNGVNTGISDSNGSVGAAGTSIGGGTWSFGSTAPYGASGFTIELCTQAAAAAAAAPALAAVNQPALIVSNSGWRGAGHSR